MASYLGDYENLEFLGDAVLSLVARNLNSQGKRDEGLLSQRPQYVSKDFLAGAGRLFHSGCNQGRVMLKTLTTNYLLPLWQMSLKHYCAVYLDMA